jgi:DNA-binding transcriptional regulator YdaS (Cro superfamily)
MTLDEYLKEASLSQSEFGGELSPPASQALISQWVRGITRVTLDYALQIERVTNGRVTPQDCADMFRDPNTRRAGPPQQLSSQPQ